MKKLNKQELRERTVKSVIPRRRFKGVIKSNTSTGEIPAGDIFYPLKQVMDDHIEKEIHNMEKAYNINTPGVNTYIITMKPGKGNWDYGNQIIIPEMYGEYVEVISGMKLRPDKIYNVTAWKKIDNGKKLFKTLSGQFYVLRGEIDTVRRDK